MLNSFKRLMFPISLSKGLEIVEELAPKGNRPEHWCAYPVQSLIEIIGDINVWDVTPDHILEWYKVTSHRDSQRTPGKPLSVFTVNSYAKALISYFNYLHKVGHVDENPAALLKLPKLPRKKKKDIPLGDIEKMVQYADRNTRDLAIVLTLRDTGCRIGGLVSMTVSGLHFEEYQKDGETRWRGRGLVHEKQNKLRWVYFSHDCCVAIKRYLRIRHHNAPDDLWLTNGGKPISKWGIYQVLKRIGKAAGVPVFNPHAFRHAAAKRLLDNGAPAKVVQELLGHEDVHTTMMLYIQYDEEELQDLHDRFNLL